MKRWDAERALWTMREQQMQQQISDLQGLVVRGSCLTCGKIDAVCTSATHDLLRRPRLRDSAVGSLPHLCWHAQALLVML